MFTSLPRGYSSAAGLCRQRASHVVAFAVLKFLMTAFCTVAPLVLRVSSTPFFSINCCAFTFVVRYGTYSSYLPTPLFHFGLFGGIRCFSAAPPSVEPLELSNPVSECGFLFCRWLCPPAETDEHDCYQNEANCCILIHYLLMFSIAVLTKFTNNGCGLSTVLWYSGWNCVPMYHFSPGISTISTSPLSGFLPTQSMPAFSNCCS